MIPGYLFAGEAIQLTVAVSLCDGCAGLKSP